MATDKKRVIVYLDESDKAALDAIAHKMGFSVSRLAGDVILGALPNLATVAEAVDLARSNPDKAREVMLTMADSAIDELTNSVEGLK